jgi:hypothetical protein
VREIVKTLKYILMSSCCVLLLACGVAPADKAGVTQEPDASALALRGEKTPRHPPARARPRTEVVQVASTTPLSNGVAVTNISGAYDSVQYWSIEVPAGAANLVVTTDGGPGDADLYVRRGALPRTIRSGDPAYDCLGYSGDNSENCTIENPAAGTWYIMVHGFSTFSGVTLVATYRMPGILGSWNANIELAKPACTVVLLNGFPSVCFNPNGSPTEPGITLTYTLPTSGGTVTGSQTLTSNMSSFILYNTRGNQTFGAATFEQLGITFPSGAPTSLCRDRLAIFSSPAPAATWPRLGATGGTTRVESGDPWGGTGFPKFGGVDVTSSGVFTYKHPCRTTVEFRAQ